MSDQNYGGPPQQQGGWSQVPQPNQPPAAPGYGAGSAQYPPPPPPPPGYGAGPGYPPPPPGQPPYGQPPYNQPPYGTPTPQGQGLTANTAAAIAYLTFIPAIIFLVIDPYKRISLVRFHAWQCIVLTCVSVAVSIAFMILGFLPLHFLWVIFMLVHTAIDIALFVFWLIAIIKASKGERYHIPGIGPIAENFAAKV